MMWFFSSLMVLAVHNNASYFALIENVMVLSILCQINDIELETRLLNTLCIFVQTDLFFFKHLSLVYVFLPNILILDVELSDEKIDT